MTGWYSAVSKLKNTDTRDGIGVRWNWPKDLDSNLWGTKGAISLVAFPDEAVAYGEHRGMALRLINRGKEAAVFRGCDSGLPLIQEARDDKGRWREIENVRSSWCGNSYHDLRLAPNEYWEFAAPRYAGAVKTKIRFRLQARRDWIYSNEFDGQISKVQLRMGPTAVEMDKAMRSKDAKEAGVMQTLIEALEENPKDRGANHWLMRVAEHVAELGAPAKDAAPALRKFRDDNKSEPRATAAYALWRIDGNIDACLKTLLPMLEDRKDELTPFYAARQLWHIGPPAKDAVPALCRAVENGDERLREMAIGTLGGIRARPELAVPVLVKALKPQGSLRSSVAAEALAEFGADAKAAVPALLELLKNAKDHDRVEAAFALWRIEGKTEPAVPILIEEVRSGQAYWAAQRLGAIGPPAKAAVPELTRVLKKDDYGLIAAHALWKITRQPEPTLSTAIRALEKDTYRFSDDAIRILKDLGPQAKSAVPALLAAHKAARLKEHESLQAEIEQALRKIDPDAVKKAGNR